MHRVFGFISHLKSYFHCLRKQTLLLCIGMVNTIIAGEPVYIFIDTRRLLAARGRVSIINIEKINKHKSRCCLVHRLEIYHCRSKPIYDRYESSHFPRSLLFLFYELQIYRYIVHEYENNCLTFYEFHNNNIPMRAGSISKTKA